MSEKKFEQKNKDLIDLRDLKGMEVIKHVVHPEAYVRRLQAVNAAKSGDVAPNCTHPIRSIRQAVDDREPNRQVNLMECTLCHCVLWLTDAWGRAAADEQ
jgi:hypothetical protein